MLPFAALAVACLRCTLSRTTNDRRHHRPKCDRLWRRFANRNLSTNLSTELISLPKSLQLGRRRVARPMTRTTDLVISRAVCSLLNLKRVEIAAPVVPDRAACSLLHLKRLAIAAFRVLDRTACSLLPVKRVAIAAAKVLALRKWHLFGAARHHLHRGRRRLPNVSVPLVSSG